MLTVFEIYESIQGESTHAGRPCVFVRLAACDLRCAWCDTPYAFTGGTKKSVDDVVGEVEGFGARMVEITGGEPMLQREVTVLMQKLLDAGHEVLSKPAVTSRSTTCRRRWSRSIDVKCPGSGESARMHWPNLEQLSPHDEVKFVIADRVDFEYACEVVRRYDLTARAAAVLYSPVHGVLAGRGAGAVDPGRAASRAIAASTAQVHLES
jgi:7-carboxy-7-deazaguanine synthase